MASFIINSLFLCQIINMVTIGGIIPYPRLDRAQSTDKVASKRVQRKSLLLLCRARATWAKPTEYKDASHALGMTSTRLSAIHKAQTPSPAGLPLT